MVIFDEKSKYCFARFLIKMTPFSLFTILLKNRQFLEKKNDEFLTLFEILVAKMGNFLIKNPLDFFWPKSDALSKNWPIFNEIRNFQRWKWEFSVKNKPLPDLFLLLRKNLCWHITSYYRWLNPVISRKLYLIPGH